MKEITHYVFSTGASLYALSVLGLLTWPAGAASVWLSISVNYVIDLLGHSNRGHPSRTRLTHSVLTAPFWGASISFVSVVIFAWLTSSKTEVQTVMLWAVAGALVAMGHLFLDSLTQAGVYYWKHRMAIAHFRYDNPALNGSFALFGLGLIILAVVPGALIERTIALSLLESLAAGP
ncbi:MAG: DUF1286 domain-containing protein [Nitrososphaerota archaeon]|jgi:hypothetical protein|nr:DUF1286 domain-containing protein [Nitrososphaerota archaeon]